MSTVILSFPQPSIAIITLNRPEKRNALNLELLKRLLDAIHSLKDDSKCLALILNGAGAKFCSGLDLAEANDSNKLAESAYYISEVLNAIHYFPKVTLASVHGAAFAGGAGLMTACDLVILAENTQICFPEVRRGLVPAFIMPFLMKRLKPTWVNELLLLAEPISAERSLAIGLANSIVPGEQLTERSITIAEKILLAGPSALLQTKNLMRQLDPFPSKEQLAIAHSFHESARQSIEAVEGIEAYFQNRPPNWIIH